MDMEGYREKFKELKCCVLIPTYNNEKTLADVIRSVQEYTDQVIVVNDGSTDSTASIIESFDGLDHYSYKDNQGKGYALRMGFKYAASKGYNYAITIDSDGQHFTEDLPKFIDYIVEKPGSLLVGSRNMDQDSVPGKSSFGHKFSNFWFKFETGIDLPDTQSGYRLYPLEPLKKMRFYTKKYEFEIEVIVRAAWKGINVDSVPIKVYYAPAEERISHFRPFRDFSRVSVLNTVLVIYALLIVKPFQFVRSLTRENIKKFLNENIFQSKESYIKITLAVAFGVFMGVVPIWGAQMIVALALAHIFRLNKVIVIVAANISIPPMIPFILYGSFLTGGLFMKGDKLDLIHFQNNPGLELVKEHMFQYIVGSMVFAVILGALVGLTTYILLLTFRSRKQKLKIKTQEI